MKVEIVIGEGYYEPLVKIYASKYTSEIEKIRDYILTDYSGKLTVFKDKKVHIIDPADIIRIYAQDKKTMVKAKSDLFSSRLSLKEFEPRLDKNSFIRISRSEIVNLDHVKRLDLSFTGTIAVEFKNGDVSYVSRRKLSKFRKALGL